MDILPLVNSEGHLENSACFQSLKLDLSSPKCWSLTEDGPDNREENGVNENESLPLLEPDGDTTEQRDCVDVGCDDARESGHMSVVPVGKSLDTVQCQESSTDFTKAKDKLPVSVEGQSQQVGLFINILINSLQIFNNSISKFITKRHDSGGTRHRSCF